MKRLYLALLILALAMLACSLEPTANLSGSVSTATPNPSPAPLLFPTKPNPPITCEVNAAEALHLRDAPGLTGSVIAWLDRGEILTLSADPPAGDWLKVITAEGLSGWVNGRYCARRKP